MPDEKPLNVILSNPMCLHMQIDLNEAFVLLCLFFFLFTNMSFIYKHYKDKLYAAILIYCKQTALMPCIYYVFILFICYPC